MRDNPANERVVGAAVVASSAGRATEAGERNAARWRGVQARQRASADQPESRAASPEHEMWTRVAERAFPTLADNVRDYAIFLMSPDGIIIYWGEGARRMKGWARDEIVGAHFRALFINGGSEHGTAEDHLAQATQSGELVTEGSRVRCDESTFWAGCTLTALRETDGTLLGFAKVTRDLTARRAAEAALVTATQTKQAHAAAEAVSAAKSEFVATMSHEVRTPINAVLGYADLLTAGIEGPLTAGQRTFVERVRTSALHLQGLVEDVLELSRIDADGAAIEPRVGRVDVVVAAALALVEPQARAQGLEMVDDVRTHAASLSYWGDEARVRQILVDLLANALQFAHPRDGAPARVTVSAGAATQPPTGVHLRGDGPWVYVRVEDTGPGIPDEWLGAVFEPFVQVGRRSNNPVSGAGLGLTISRRLARRMGGEISLESTVGVGSAFVVWLPVAPLTPVASLRTGGSA